VRGPDALRHVAVRQKPFERHPAYAEARAERNSDTGIFWRTDALGNFEATGPAAGDRENSNAIGSQETKISTQTAISGAG